jgi:hypothetical protein
MSQNYQISEFWKWFERNEAELRCVSSDDDPICDEALFAIQRIDRRLYFEIGMNGTPSEFIVTASGRKSNFPLVEDVVAAAPSVAGWKFFALKPPMGFDFEITYEGTSFDPKEMWFKPLARASDRRAFGIRVGIPNYDSRLLKRTLFAVFIILDTALGERSAAIDISRVDVCTLPTDPGAKGYVALSDLPRYIKWRKRRHMG